jgi:hypothetical protein
MDQFTNHFDVITGDNNGSERTTTRGWRLSGDD